MFVAAIVVSKSICVRDRFEDGTASGHGEGQSRVSAMAAAIGAKKLSAWS
jgi:hypothetical protein